MFGFYSSDGTSGRHIIGFIYSPKSRGCNVQTATFQQEVISGHKSQSGLDTKTTDHQSYSNFYFDFGCPVIKLSCYMTLVM
jgi:hypothetical protein